MATKSLRRYIIMSDSGFLNPVLFKKTFQPSGARVALAARPEATIAEPQMQVLDSIHEDGPKLVEMPAEGELSLRLSMPGLKIVPEVFYERQWERFKILRRPTSPKVAVKKAKGRAAKGAKGKKAAGRVGKAAATEATAPAGFTINVTDSQTDAPIKGAKVIAFTDFEARAGAEGTTKTNGSVTLKGLSPTTKLDRVYLYAPAGYWGFFATDTKGSKLSKLALDKIDVKDPTLLLTELYGGLPAMTGQGVTIGIIDSGVDGTHPDLPNVTGGLNCVSDEVRGNPGASGNWRPALKEGEHGTHVAGIAAGRGLASGFRGVAPGANLRSYRVFPDSGGGASNFDIAKAIDIAVTEKCDVINMSLGGGPKDDLTRAAVDRAIAAGVVVIAAAGNGGRKPVSFPATLPECVAVSAMGRIGSFPAQATGNSDIAPPRGGPSSRGFVAAFSNFGTEIDTTGPGVEIVSTLPGTGHGAMSGTSMAAPAVAGVAAHLLSANPALQQKIGADRSRALKDLLYSCCKPEAFGRDFEGFGLPLP
jgi:subtilisin